MCVAVCCGYVRRPASAVCVAVAAYVACVLRLQCMLLRVLRLQCMLLCVLQCVVELRGLCGFSSECVSRPSSSSFSSSHSEKT